MAGFKFAVPGLKRKDQNVVLAWILQPVPTYQMINHPIFKNNCKLYR